MRTPGEQAQTMQRVKVGMTGLAVVLLLIGVASLVLRSISHQRPAFATANAAMAAPSVGNDTGEPLAELGAAPSTEADNSAAPARGRRR